jgi:hypothetical protein
VLRNLGLRWDSRRGKLVGNHTSPVAPHASEAESLAIAAGYVGPFAPMNEVAGLAEVAADFRLVQFPTMGTPNYSLSMSGWRPVHQAKGRRRGSYCGNRGDSAERPVIRSSMTTHSAQWASFGRAGSDCNVVDASRRLNQAACRRICSWALPIPFSHDCPMAAAFSIRDWAVPIARQ